MIWADMWWVVRGSYHGFGGIWILICLSAVEMGRVFEVEGKGYKWSDSYEYIS